MMRANRLLARARAADIVEFNESLNLSRTAIDILAAEQVPEDALKEAVERRKNDERITVEVAQKIADTWLAKKGKSRRKPPKKKQRGEPVTLKTDPTAFAHHLGDNFEPEKIHRIAENAARRSARSTAYRWNSMTTLDALRWVKPALAKTAAKDTGSATGSVLVGDGFISAYDGSLLARAPCPEDGTFMLDGTALEAFLEDDPRIRDTDDRVLFSFPEDDEDEWSLDLKKLPIETFAPKAPDVIGRYPEGDHYKLPRSLSFALAYFRHLTSPKPGRRVENGVWLVGDDVVVVNLPKYGIVIVPRATFDAGPDYANPPIRIAISEKSSARDKGSNPDFLYTDYGRSYLSDFFEAEGFTFEEVESGDRRGYEARCRINLRVMQRVAQQLPVSPFKGYMFFPDKLQKHGGLQLGPRKLIFATTPGKREDELLTSEGIFSRLLSYKDLRNKGEDFLEQYMSDW